MIDIFISLFTLSVISSCVGLFVASDLISFTKTFVVASIVQIILYSVYKQAVMFMAERLRNERIKEFSKQGMEVVCPCSKAVRTFIPIQLDQDNSYKCMDCSRNIAVGLEVKTFMTTDPVDIPKTSAALNLVYGKIANNQTTEDESEYPHSV